MADSTTSISGSSGFNVVTDDDGKIHIGKLGNGTDFDAIIDAQMKAEGLNKTKLESWKTDWEKKLTTVQDLNTKFLTYRSNLSYMDTMGEFLTKKIGVTDTNVLSATPTTDAEEGIHKIEVNQLAQNHIMTQSAGVADKTAEIVPTGGSTETLELTYGTGADAKTMKIDVAPGTTLEGLAQIINRHPDNAGVQAKVLYDGSKYYMQLSGKDLGADNTISINDANTTLAGFSTGDFTEIQQAQNAELRVDGWPKGSWIESDSNAVTDAVPGITLNLRSTGTTSIEIQNDSNAILNHVADFLDMVNDMKSSIKELTKYDPETKKAGLLQGDYSMSLISNLLNEVTSQHGIGFNGDTDAISTLAQLGIETDAKTGSPTFGMLTVDEEVFLKKLREDPQSVAEFFAADGIGSTDSGDVTFSSKIDGITKPGKYAVSYDVDAAGNITNAFIGGKPASVNGLTITAGSDTDAKGAVLTVNNLTAGSYTANLSLKQGKAGELHDALTEMTVGEKATFKVLTSNYTQMVENLTKQISDEETRLKTYEKNLREKYSRLDKTLAEYTSMQKTLDDQLKQLNAGD
ncbi:flagellar filament capping protein FliD [Desulfobaculum bizertense]|uniref:Flagellar hook-associated protein 2 n=1 Tax=Desulfobaculum bizertense DSM 18034 TaxID=1121442 RepID=A0A1T4VW31_9BACT|nr:flagellar filament capping protein FliD [Desulfobaculum bizertense]SKA69202.1 flagellar hook-associated protein 2 [Desulfobaculum bizertense DSM 18034]